MSWYLANEKRIIDQFATIAGLKDLREAAESYPNLRDFFVEGVTENIRQCTEELNQLANETSDQDVKVTAQGLAKLMRGQGVVVITQGFGYEDDEEEDGTSESLPPQEPAKPVGPVAHKAKKNTALKKKPAAGKAEKKAAPTKDRAWFERKVAELKSEAGKLPAERQKELKRTLKKGK